jgi:hypothetical protein
MTVAGDQEKRKLGKGVAFVKSRLRTLPQGHDIWEADFRALPKPVTQTVTHYQGLVVLQTDGSLIADFPVHRTPSVNDLATLLAHAMRRPLTEDAQRPRRIVFRKNPRWKELFPRLNEIGVEVSLENELPTLNGAVEDYLRRIQEARPEGKIEPSAEQARVEEAFPAIARWVKSYGHVEIGAQEGFGFVVRALGYGGLDFEDDRPTTLTEAMAALEDGLARWFQQEGIEPD